MISHRTRRALVMHTEVSRSSTLRLPARSMSGLDDARALRTVTLRRPDIGLMIGPGIWRELVNFSSNACLVVLASEHYDESDYIRDHAAFRAAVAEGIFD